MPFAKHQNGASHCSGAGLGGCSAGRETAFLYADLEEEVFVAQPPFYETKDKDGGPLVMRPENSLYGLAQSPGNWFHTIDPVLEVIGFIPLKSDTCTYLQIPA